MLAILLMATSCQQQTQKRTIEPTPVKVQEIENDEHQSIRHYVGTIESEVAIPIRFTLGGTLTAIYVHNGQKVRKGNVIARVDDTSAKSMHDAALATLRQAEDGYARLQKVHKEGGVSDVKWMQMETDLEKARQSEISTRKMLNDCTAYASADGVISCDDHQIGENLRPTETFGEIIDLDKLEIKFSIPEKDINNVNVGQVAKATLPALNNMEVAIEITDKSVVANKMGHTYNIRGRIRESAEKRSMLKPGMVAKVSLSSTGNTGIFIPANCVQVMTNGLAVWCVDSDSIASRRQIEISDYVRNGVLVTEGLKEGDIVVTEGYQKLYTGAKVRY